MKEMGIRQLQRVKGDDLKESAVITVNGVCKAYLVPVSKYTLEQTKLDHLIDLVEKLGSRPVTGVVTEPPAVLGHSCQRPGILCRGWATKQADVLVGEEKESKLLWLCDKCFILNEQAMKEVQ